jgi:hypothetical protein
MATITVNELATTLDTDPRTARKFLRSVTPLDAQPGKGGRWMIEKREVRSLAKKFTKYEADRAAARAARDAEGNDDAPEEGTPDEG